MATSKIKTSSTITFWGTGGPNSGSLLNLNNPTQLISLVNGWSASKQNYPTNFPNGYGILFSVPRWENDFSSLVAQVLISTASGAMYVRNCENGTWGSWTSI